MSTTVPRRRVLHLGAAAALLGAPAVHRAWAAPGRALPLTPAQAEGPFYPPQLPADHDHDLLRNGERVTRRGQPASVEGRVVDPEGRPVRGAVVEIWQCDAHGVYHHPADRGPRDADFQGFGRVAVDAEGGWRFRTIRPVPYGQRTPHIHFKVWLGRQRLLTTQLYVEGDPGNARDFLWRRLGAAERALITVPFRPAAEGLQASFPIVVRA
jgi:protocatechuate 3,4-dioxygenase beta subunit